jgi:hypothetical protein
LIRSGTNWENVEANLRAVNALNIHTRPSITVSAMNVFRIPVIIDRLIEIGTIKKEYENWSNFSINVVEFSPRFHVSILSDAYRKEIKQQLEDYIANYKIKYGVDIRHLFLHLFWHLDKPQNIKWLEDFKNFTATIDKMRGENTLATIPELQEALG